ncbi:sporulation integral membrane protein YlbJ [Metabacillus herbersteinensis]|uniref:Sporulation integral membrane protein YlbJ n=1 Tax=Metabacillus herbersteinensis TaxID=283816 RepID=A0ABV6GBX9_9BACI
MSQSMLKTIIIAFFISGITIAIIVNPGESLVASKTGLTMWWEIVFPSLLPFFIVSELLIGFGVVQFIGVLLEPFMRPVFRVPGVGGFVWAMGMASGFPAGAKLTARLRQEKQISALEAERLVSFTNCSNPIFIFGAVAVGFFNNPALGVLLAAAHYLGNLFVGLTMRFHGAHEKRHSPTRERFYIPSIRTAFKELHQTRIQDDRPIGKKIGDAVLTSIQSLLMIGGFIILFSVFNKLLMVIHLTEYLGIALGGLLTLLGIASDLSVPLISGIFEITQGNNLTSDANADLLDKAIIASFILAFSGLSVQAQVASILAETDIGFKPFFIARILQGIYSSIFAFVLFKPLYLNLESQLPSEYPVFFMQQTPEWATLYWNVLTEIGPIVTLISLTVYLVIYGKRTLLSKTI